MINYFCLVIFRLFDQTTLNFSVTQRSLDHQVSLIQGMILFIYKPIGNLQSVSL